MRISEMLHAIASWLESPDNEALLLAEYDEDCLKVVASSCVEAAHALKRAAAEVDAIEPPEESYLTPEAIEGLADIATAFDASDDEGLKKQASVIDELLLTIAATPEGVSDKKTAQFNRLEELKKKYENVRKELRDTNKIADSERAIDKSKMTKQYTILEAPLSTRYCPDHPGAQVARVGEHMYQCDLDRKIYNFESGFTLNDGSTVPGGDVAQQTKGIDMPSHSIFDTRSERLGTNTP